MPLNLGNGSDPIRYAGRLLFELMEVTSQLISLLLNIDWYNFQENGNWTVDDAQRCHMHLHVYGRDRQSVKQPFGEALSFPTRKENSNSELVEYSESQVNQLRKYAKELTASL